MYWVISVWFDLRNTLPKSGPFLLLHPVYLCSHDVTVSVIIFSDYSVNITVTILLHTTHTG